MSDRNIVFKMEVQHLVVSMFTEPRMWCIGTSLLCGGVWWWRFSWIFGGGIVLNLLILVSTLTTSRWPPIAPRGAISTFCA